MHVRRQNLTPDVKVWFLKWEDGVYCKAYLYRQNLTQGTRFWPVPNFDAVIQPGEFLTFIKSFWCLQSKFSTWKWNFDSKIYYLMPNVKQFDDHHQQQGVRRQEIIEGATFRKNDVMMMSWWRHNDGFCQNIGGGAKAPQPPCQRTSCFGL